MAEMPWDRARGANKTLTFIVFIVRRHDYDLWTVPDRSLVDSKLVPSSGRVTT